jgi:ParB family transcriptional regulator, chromosome partitioning protein
VPPKARSRPTLADFEVAAAAVPPVDDRLVHQVPVAAIRPSPRNPRRALEGIDELATSLGEHGLLQPVVVRRVAEGYELIAGHRRLEAWKTLERPVILAVVRDETQDQAYILTLVENLQREDLTPKEEAAALEVLVRERGWSTRQVGEAIGRSHMYVSKRLRVFDDAVLADPVLAGELAVSTAEELLRAPEPERASLAARAVAEGWGQPEARAAVQAWKVTFQGRPSSPDREARLRTLADELAALNANDLSPGDRRQITRLLEVLTSLVQTRPSRRPRQH